MSNSKPLELSENEIDRYGRQLILSNWNSEKQLRLKQLRAAVSAQLPSAVLYLAAAGVGKLLIFDCDEKSIALLEHARLMNPDITIESWNESSENAVNCVIYCSEEPTGLNFVPPITKLSFNADENNVCQLSDQGKEVILLGLPENNIVDLPAGALAAMTLLRWWGSTFSTNSHNP